MSSSDHLAHRRRSHSTSSPIPRRHPDDLKWHISAKRSRPSSIRGPSYKELAHDLPAEKWDVDQWRRGKRARRDSNTDSSSDEASAYCSNIPSSDPIIPVEQTPASECPSTSRLPSSSAAFQFFSVPQKNQHPRPRCGTSSARARLSREPSPRGGERISSDEVRRIRTDALGELHRSVTESGEGFVRRMRDWERSRFRSARPERHALGSPYALDTHHNQARRSRRPTSYYGVSQAAAAVAEQSEDDEDDLLIVGEASSLPATHSPAHKKRALSLGTMDVDLPEVKASPFVGLGGSDRSSSPIDRSSGVSVYSSDDEGQADMDTDLSSSGIFFTPALSHTYSVSTNSSLTSLPLSLQVGEAATTAINASPSSTPVIPGCSSPPATHLPSTASRSEKAIAALILAMANGAAGISDYEALRVAEELTTLDASHAGELWS